MALLQEFPLTRGQQVSDIIYNHIQLLYTALLFFQRARPEDHTQRSHPRQAGASQESQEPCLEDNRRGQDREHAWRHEVMDIPLTIQMERTQIDSVG